jgi:hypothetical protein
MLFLAFVTAIVGIYFLNQNGSYTQNKKHRLISVIFSITSVVLFAYLYGTARGMFIYLGVISLFGIVLTVVNTIRKPK